MAADFAQMTLRINLSTVAEEGDFGVGYGFAEKYYFPIGGFPDYATYQQVAAARASLLARNAYIANIAVSKASLYRDSWPFANPVTQPLETDGDTEAEDGSWCNMVQDGLLIRFESQADSSGNVRRWERTIRAIRDSWTTDMNWVPPLTAAAYGNPVPGPLLPGDIAYPALLALNSGSGTQGRITLTVAGGVVTTATFAGADAGTNLAFNGSGTTSTSFSLGGWSPTEEVGGVPRTISGLSTTLDVTLTAGAITGAAINVPASNAATYTNGTYHLLIQPALAPAGLPWYLSDDTYLLNFCSLIAQKCINFNPIRVTPAAAPPGNRTWPAGSMMTQVNTNAPYTTAPYTAARFMVERTTVRQTGRIWTSSKARKKIAR